MIVNDVEREAIPFPTIMQTSASFGGTLAPFAAVCQERAWADQKRGLNLPRHQPVF